MPLQPTQTPQLDQRPAPNQPRSQRPWVGHLVSSETKETLGITEGLLRLSVGLEAIGDLWDDLAAALAASQVS